MHSVKQDFSEGVTISINIAEDNVYTQRTGCGREFPADLLDSDDEDGDMMSSNANYDDQIDDYIPLEHPLITINIDRLYYAAYTRPVNKAQVKRIVDNFNPNRFDLPVINFRDNKFWVVNGKQRIEAAKILGYTHVQCRMMTSVEPDQKN